jgi:hypothetical protein
VQFHVGSKIAPLEIIITRHLWHSQKPSWNFNFQTLRSDYPSKVAAAFRSQPVKELVVEQSYDLDGYPCSSSGNLSCAIEIALCKFPLYVSATPSFLGSKTRHACVCVSSINIPGGARKVSAQHRFVTAHFSRFSTWKLRRPPFNSCLWKSCAVNCAQRTSPTHTRKRLWKRGGWNEKFWL